MNNIKKKRKNNKIIIIEIKQYVQFAKQNLFSKHNFTWLN